MNATSATDQRALIDDLPGDLMMWVLIVSELLVFGAGMLAFLAVRITDPAGFAEAQSHLHRTAAGINTLVLVTSGWLAALAVRDAEAGALPACAGGWCWPPGWGRCFCGSRPGNMPIWPARV